VVDPASGRMTVEDFPDLRPRPGQVVVRVHSAGVNRADLNLVAGTYGALRTGRFTLGGELARTVVEVGEAASRYRVGNEIMALGAGYAEMAVVDERLCMPFRGERGRTKLGGCL
jgi:NADPH2:quinone reductase